MGVAKFIRVLLASTTTVCQLSFGLLMFYRKLYLTFEEIVI